MSGGGSAEHEVHVNGVVRKMHATLVGALDQTCTQQDMHIAVDGAHIAINRSGNPRLTEFLCVEIERRVNRSPALLARLNERSETTLRPCRSFDGHEAPRLIWSPTQARSLSVQAPRPFALGWCRRKILS